MLLVANRKHGARDAVARAVACGKFGNDVLDNVPLPRAGVLRLVDQHVVDAAVELVMHPAGGNLVQHEKRLVDQVVIIEQAALLLFASVVCRRGSCDMQKRRGAVAGNHRAAFFDQRQKPQNLFFEQAGDRRIVADECLGQDRRARLFFISEKDTEIFVYLRRADKGQRSTQLLGLILILPAADAERVRDFRPTPARQVRSIDDLALNLFDTV